MHDHNKRAYRVLVLLGVLLVLLLSVVRCASPPASPSVNTAAGQAGAVPASYTALCSSCHGYAGEGSAYASPFDHARLRAMGTDEIGRLIREGVPGTAMIAWNRTLSAAQIEELAVFIAEMQPSSSEAETESATGASGE